MTTAVQKTWPRWQFDEAADAIDQAETLLCQIEIDWFEPGDGRYNLWHDRLEQARRESRPASACAIADDLCQAIQRYLLWRKRYERRAAEPPRPAPPVVRVMMNPRAVMSAAHCRVLTPEEKARRAVAKSARHAANKAARAEENRQRALGFGAGTKGGNATRGRG